VTGPRVDLDAAAWRSTARLTKVDVNDVAFSDDFPHASGAALAEADRFELDSGTACHIDFVGR